jgi:hypothetical protein
LHQDAADHTAPTYETYVHDFIPFEWKLPRIFARSDRAGKMGGHDGRSALRDRFRGNRFDECVDANGELDRTGRCAVLFGNRGDLGDLSHRDNIHENRTLATEIAAASHISSGLRANWPVPELIRVLKAFKSRFKNGSAAG